MKTTLPSTSRSELALGLCSEGPSRILQKYTDQEEKQKQWLQTHDQRNLEISNHQTLQRQARQIEGQVLEQSHGKPQIITDNQQHLEISQHLPSQKLRIWV